MREAGEEINRKGETEAEAGIRKPLSALSQRVLRPLEPVLARFSNWQLSPDAALWLVPWGALPLEDGSYALEKHTINYLVSGRDLLTASAVGQGKAGPALVVADPDFDLRGRCLHPSLPAEAAPDLRRRRWRTDVGEPDLDELAAAARHVRRSRGDLAERGAFSGSQAGGAHRGAGRRGEGEAGTTATGALAFHARFFPARSAAMSLRRIDLVRGRAARDLERWRTRCCAVGWCWLAQTSVC